MQSKAHIVLQSVSACCQTQIQTHASPKPRNLQRPGTNPRPDSKSSSTNAICNLRTYYTVPSKHVAETHLQTCAFKEQMSLSPPPPKTLLAGPSSWTPKLLSLGLPRYARTPFHLAPPSQTDPLPRTSTGVFASQAITSHPIPARFCFSPPTPVSQVPTFFPRKTKRSRGMGKTEKTVI